MNREDSRREITSPRGETTFDYNEDVECVMERIHEYLAGGNDEDVEYCAAAIVDQLFWRWFGQEHYEIQRIRAAGGGDAAKS